MIQNCDQSGRCLMSEAGGRLDNNKVQNARYKMKEVNGGKEQLVTN